MTATPSVDTTTGWWREGERRLATLVDALPDDAFDGPTTLPGWSRRVLVAHLARNADALGNLLTWARTGVETPMYTSPEARQRDIDRTAQESPAALRQDLAGAASRLLAAADDLDAAHWHTEVRTAQGRTVPAGEVTWMRAKEVWVHAVDLATGTGFAAAPAELLHALVDDVLATWQRRGEAPDLVLKATDTGARWDSGAGTDTIDAPLAQLAALVTGRPADVAAGHVTLPRWL